MILLFRNVFSYLKPYKLLSFLILGCLLIEYVFYSFYSLSFKFLIDDAVTPHNLRNLIIILVALGIGVIAISVITVAKDYLYARLGSSVISDLRNKLFLQMQTLSREYYSRTRPGDITSHFSTELSAIENVVVYALPGIISSVIGTVFSIAIMLVLEWKLTLLAVAGLSTGFLGPYLINKKTEAANDELKEQQAALISTIEENVQAQNTIRSFGLQKQILLSFQNQVNKLFMVTKRAGILNNCMQDIPTISNQIFNFVVICLGVVLAFNDKLSIGTLMAFNKTFQDLGYSIGSFTWILPYLMEAAAGMKRIDEFLNEKPKVVDKQDGLELKAFREGIRFQDVSFGYTDETIVLDHVDVEIPKGFSVAFVGPSGSGKSTILNLVLRFYDPQKGEVTIDGINLADLQKNSLHRRIGVVQQENFLFNASVRENLKLIKEDASDEEIINAANAAEIHDFISQLEDGYDTVTGERGSRFSGGQKQRVAIARALIRDPDILILDEATSALDPVSEVAVDKTLKRIAEGKTVIAVTHRLAQVVDYDLVYVMDKGRIVEKGKHEELRELNGLYRRLWDKQQGFTIDYARSESSIERERLKKIPIFEGLDDGLLDELYKRFVSETYEENRIIIKENDTADRFYILVRGKVEVFKDLEDGTHIRINVLQDGDHFGEIGLMRNVKRTASIKTLTHCMLLSLSKEMFQTLTNDLPEVRQKLEELMDIRLNELKQKS